MATILGANTLSDDYQVANSVRFNPTDSAYMHKTPNAGNRRTATFSFWTKRSLITSAQTLFWAGSDNSNYQTFPRFLASDKLVVGEVNSGSTTWEIVTDRILVDAAAWYHIVVALDTTQGTAANRVKIYVNGVQQTNLNTDGGYPGENRETLINTAVPHQIAHDYVGQYYGGYVAEVCFLEGSQNAPTDFGEFDGNGVWKPIDVTGLTFGNNGFYLPFTGNGSNTAFVDSGPDARAVTAVNDVVHSFTQAKFGESSIYLDGVNDKLTMPDSNDFDFGTGNFTWEAWIYKPLTGKESIYETRTSGDNNGFNLEFNANDKFEWYDTSIAGDNDLPRDPNAITANTWTHYAVVRNGAICTMYRDGTSVGTPKDVGTDADMVSAGQSIIGINAAGQAATSFEGFFDEMRLSSVARYTGNFTAPSAAFTSDSDTVFLIQSKASNLLGADTSGEGNHNITSGLNLLDHCTDTCTNNFCTINPLDNEFAVAVFAEGNTRVTTNAGAEAMSTGTFALSAGRWYFEVDIIARGSTAQVGITPHPSQVLSSISGKAGDVTPHARAYLNTGKVQTGDGSGGQTDLATLSSFTTGDIIGVYVDLEDMEFYVSKNGTLQNSGTGLTITALDANSHDHTSTGHYLAYVGDNTSGTAAEMEVNFGNPHQAQSSSVSDDNGYGAFEYSPNITGDSVAKKFYAICTKNLAEFG